MRMLISAMLLASMMLCSWGPAQAALKDDIGYTRLATELGTDLLRGSGVKVTQVEAEAVAGTYSYAPNPAGSDFTGKTFVLKSGTYPYSGHATGVGQLFYGNYSSLSPGITSIENYLVNDWLGTGFLNYGVSNQPQISSSRVANHSYVGSYGFALTDVKLLKRLDWLVNRDEYIQVAAMNNGTYNQALFGSSFNAITVGLSSGNHAIGGVDLGSAPYGAGRTRPDVVVPLSYTSSATPVVASAAALLVDLGHKNPGLSQDPLQNFTRNRNGDVIYNAERSEVVKAALMAGADRTAPLLTKGYTVNTANGLNSTYGAGQLNIFSSYHVIAAGEQNSREDYLPGGGEIKAAGFDYDPQFGGLNGSNRTASYIFKALTTGELCASLVWNVKVDGGTETAFNYTTELYHLGLYLYDITTSMELAHATGAADNTENLWWTNLTPNHAYMLKVTAEQSDFLWDYGLAWDITATTTHAPVPPTAILLGSGLVGLLILKRRRPQS